MPKRDGGGGNSAKELVYITASRLSWDPQQAYNSLLSRNPSLRVWRPMVCNCQLKEYRDDS